MSSRLQVPNARLERALWKVKLVRVVLVKSSPGNILGL
jgi:hypothetical protein